MDPNLKNAVRQAVASGEFTRAKHLWERYVLECRHEMRNSPEPQAILEEVRLTMVWCRQMALAARAQTQAQLDNLARRSRVAAAYCQPASPRPGSIRTNRY